MPNHFIYDGVVNDTAQRQWLQNWYYKVYKQNYSWEAKFVWELMTQFNMTYRRIHPTIYKVGDIKSFNSITKKINYTTISYQEESILMDQIFQVGRQISPIENKLVQGLLKTDLQQIATAELVQKRKKILDTLQKPNCTSQFLVNMTDEDWKDQSKVVKMFEDFVEEAGRINMNMTDILASSKVFRALKEHLKLNVYSDKQVNEFVDGKGNSKFFKDSITTIEGYTIWYILPQYEYNDENGQVTNLKQLNDETLMIGLESGSQQTALKLRVRDHTPLRVGIGAIGTGVGNQIFVEQVRLYGSGIAEPKKILRAVSSIVKKQLSDANSSYAIWLESKAPADPSLDDFKELITNQLSTNQAMFNITIDDIDFFKEDGETALTAKDIKIGTGLMPEMNTIQVKAKSSSVYFSGNKTLNINVYDGN